MQLKDPAVSSELSTPRRETALPSDDSSPSTCPLSTSASASPPSSKTTPRSSPPRFYKTREKENNAASTRTGKRPPVCGLSTTLDEERMQALNTISMCRRVITSLELTRMRKSRIGFSYWLAFWEQLYDRPLARALGTRISASLSKVDMLFRCVARELHEVANRIETAVRLASSHRQVALLLEHMELEVTIHRNNRRRKAQRILQKLRADIEAIPVMVTDELFVDLKRAIFCLDDYCDYHPGDVQAEARDRMPPNLRNIEVDPAAGLSPSLYHSTSRRFVNAAPSATTMFVMQGTTGGSVRINPDFMIYEREEVVDDARGWVNSDDDDESTIRGSPSRVGTTASNGRWQPRGAAVCHEW